MRIIIVTQYYPPEIGAPQNRLHELALRLVAKGCEVNVLTAMPNYPKMEVMDEYKGKWRYKEEMDGVHIYRSAIYVSKSKSIFKRLLNYFSFVFTSFWAGWFRLPKADVVICESPPLFLGISAYLISKLKRAKYVFNVSDLWPESAEKLGLVTNKTMLKLATRLEEFMYRKSALISGQTQGIVANIQQRFPQKQLYWLPNGVDPTLYKADHTSTWKLDNGFSEDDLLFFYGGIIGHAQGLETILQAASRLKEKKHIHFILLGAGPVKPDLLKMKDKLGLNNVHFYDPVPKSGMPDIIAAMDATIVPLKKLDIFKGAIPSKIFENMAMKKPLVLGVDGEAKKLFIDDGKAGLWFEPENDKALADCILKLDGDKELMKQFGENGRKLTEQKFNRDYLAEQFYNVLNDLVSGKK